MSRLRVIARSYFPEGEVEQWTGHMMATARRVGLEPLRFGIGEQMSTHGGSGEGPGAVAACEGVSDEFVLCCDSMDVAFLAGEEEILDKFMSLNVDFLVSGENSALHNMEKSSAVLQGYPGFFKEINVGLWIGKRTHAIKVLNYAIEKFRYHDDTSGQDTLQTWLPLMYAAQKRGEIEGPGFEIDRNCVLFQSMNRVDPATMLFTSPHKRMCNLATGTWPVALHYNGDKSRGSFMEMVARLVVGS